MNIVVNISMMIQVVINLANSDGPSPHTRERRQRRTANVLGVRRRETFRRRQLSAQVLRDVAVVDQRSSPIPLPCPPGMISNGDEEEVVHSSVETPTPSSTYEEEEEEEEEEVAAEGSPLKEEVDTPVASPAPTLTQGESHEEEEEEEMGAQTEGLTSLSDACVDYMQTVCQVWTDLRGTQSSSTTVNAERGGEEMEVGFSTPTSTSSQPPLLPTPPSAPRRERSSHHYDNIQPRRLTLGEVISPEAYDCSKPEELYAFSLKTVGSCQVTPGMVSESLEKGKALYFQTMFPSKAYRCKISGTRSITYCGMHSHASAIEPASIINLYPTPEECRKIHHTGVYLTGGDPQVVDGVKLGLTPVTILRTGSRNTDGTCFGGTYSWRGITYTNSLDHGMWYTQGGGYPPQKPLILEPSTKNYTIQSFRPWMSGGIMSPTVYRQFARRLDEGPSKDAVLSGLRDWWIGETSRIRSEVQSTYLSGFQTEVDQRISGVKKSLQDSWNWFGINSGAILGVMTVITVFKVAVSWVVNGVLIRKTLGSFKWVICGVMDSCTHLVVTLVGPSTPGAPPKYTPMHHAPHGPNAPMLLVSVPLEVTSVSMMVQFAGYRQPDLHRGTITPHEGTAPTPHSQLNSKLHSLAIIFSKLKNFRHRVVTIDYYIVILRFGGRSGDAEKGVWIVLAAFLKDRVGQMRILTVEEAVARLNRMKASGDGTLVVDDELRTEVEEEWANIKNGTPRLGLGNTMGKKEKKMRMAGSRRGSRRISFYNVPVMAAEAEENFQNVELGEVGFLAEDVAVAGWDTRVSKQDLERLFFNSTPRLHSIDSTNTPAGNIIVMSLTALRNSQRYYNDVYAVVHDFCRTLRQAATTSTSTAISPNTIGYYRKDMAPDEVSRVITDFQRVEFCSHHPERVEFVTPEGETSKWVSNRNEDEIFAKVIYSVGGFVDYSAQMAHALELRNTLLMYAFRRDVRKLCEAVSAAAPPGMVPQGKTRKPREMAMPWMSERDLDKCVVSIFSGASRYPVPGMTGIENVKYISQMRDMETGSYIHQTGRTAWKLGLGRKVQEIRNKFKEWRYDLLGSSLAVIHKQVVFKQKKETKVILYKPSPP
ncbi:unnamed protein product [Cyprideis torosa]|uniref:Uncharacterized protein n=1 Tax=Cyprideis torosa TaxID=163714 RepID=A0A7R8W6M6_9CRUS|nr:unnamed protein product [Cyprideis torosa]CAG0886676.1 unnamed protein product [Cyprideis torosa]